MKNEKSIMLTFAISIGLLSNLARLSTFGFFYLIGLLSTLFFGIIHVIFLRQVHKNYDRLELPSKIIAWIGILIYPLIFLFQFDLEEYKDAFYVYEHLTGEQTTDFEHVAYYIAILSGVLYILNFIRWKYKLKTLHQPTHSGNKVPSKKNL
ncbi:hypothetical protein [Namhaeicola litoreus]|uniref:Uncharacterized protein n=1 Tax=Namhaeicola litoreus TaxID=1052145 RepID=A0ABW3Y0K3_9FLAO